jgi:hypothetical protein
MIFILVTVFIDVLDRDNHSDHTGLSKSSLAEVLPPQDVGSASSPLSVPRRSFLRAGPGLSSAGSRRPIILIALFGLGVDYLIQFAPTIGWLFVGRVIAGIGRASPRQRLHRRCPGPGDLARNFD